MAVVGDRVQVPSKRVGQLPREGVVTGVSGGLLRVEWSTGEESTITPASGSLLVVGRVRPGARKGRAPAKASSKKAGKALAKKAGKGPAKKPAEPSAKKPAGRAAKPSPKGKGAGTSKATPKRSGAHKRGR